MLDRQFRHDGDARVEDPRDIGNPRILRTGSNFGIQTNGFGFAISWASGKVVVVEAAESLTIPAWSPVATNTLSGGTSYFSDPEWAQYPRRFYRVRGQ